MGFTRFPQEFGRRYLTRGCDCSGCSGCHERTGLGRRSASSARLWHIWCCALFKNSSGREKVRKAFEEHEILKEYLAIVCDETLLWSGERSAQLALDTSKKRVRPDENGLSATTHFSPLERHNSGMVLLKASTNYGRRHPGPRTRGCHRHTDFG